MNGDNTITIILPPVNIHQIIHIRNWAPKCNITATPNTVSIYPSQGNIYTPTYAMIGNENQHLYCDGTNWIGF